MIAVDQARIKTRIMIATACTCMTAEEAAKELDRLRKNLVALYRERDLCLKQEQFEAYTRAAFKIKLVQAEISNLIEKAA